MLLQFGSVRLRPGPAKKMALLAVGEHDLQPGWDAKSTKNRETEELIEKGDASRIISEPDFVALAAIRA